MLSCTPVQTHAHTQGEGQTRGGESQADSALSTEPDMGLSHNPETTTWAKTEREREMLKQMGHPGAPPKVLTFNKEHIGHLDMKNTNQRDTCLISAENNHFSGNGHIR